MKRNFNAEKSIGDASDGPHRYGSESHIPGNGEGSGVNALEVSSVLSGMMPDGCVMEALTSLPISSKLESDTVVKDVLLSIGMDTDPCPSSHVKTILENTTDNYRGPQQLCPNADLRDSAQPPSNGSHTLHPSQSVIHGRNLAAISTKCYERPRELTGVNNPGAPHSPSVASKDDLNLIRVTCLTGLTPIYPPFDGKAEPCVEKLSPQLPASSRTVQAPWPSRSYSFIPVVPQPRTESIFPPAPLQPNVIRKPKPTRKLKARGKSVAIPVNDQIIGEPPKGDGEHLAKSRAKSTRPKPSRPRSATPSAGDKGRGRGENVANSFFPRQEDEGATIPQLTPVNMSNVPTIPIGTNNNGHVNVNFPNIDTLDISGACLSSPPPQPLVVPIEPIEAKTLRSHKGKIDGETAPKPKIPKQDAKSRIKKPRPSPPLDDEYVVVSGSKPKRKKVRKIKAITMLVQPQALAVIQDNVKSAALAITGFAMGTGGQLASTEEANDTPEVLLQLKTEGGESSKECTPAPLVKMPSVKSPSSRKPKKRKSRTTSFSSDEATSKIVTHVDEEKTEKTPGHAEQTGTSDKRVRACLSPDIVDFVPVYHSSSIKKQRTSGRNSRTRQSLRQRSSQVMDVDSESDEGSVAQRLVPRGKTSRSRSKPAPRQGDRTSSPVSEEHVGRRTTRSSTAKLRESIPAKISMADYDTFESSDDDDKQVPERPVGSRNKLDPIPIEIMMKDKVKDVAKPDVVKTPRPKRVAKLLVGKRRPGCTSTGRRSGPLKADEGEGTELVKTQAVKKGSQTTTKVEYTSEELKRLYADGCFMRTVAHQDLDPGNNVKLYRIDRRDSCIREFYPAKYEPFLYFVSSPVRHYRAPEDMTEEKLFAIFQAIPVVEVPDQTGMFETVIQSPYNGKSFYTRMTKCLGHINKTEHFRDIFEHLHMVLARKCIHPGMLVEPRKLKPDRDPRIRCYLIFLDKIQATLTAALGKANLPEEILYLLRSFLRMKYSTQKVEKGAECNICKNVRLSSSRVLFVVKGDGYGLPYDPESLVVLDQENWPKEPEKSIHFCRSCASKAIKLHRLIHWMQRMWFNIFGNMKGLLAHLEKKNQKIPIERMLMTSEVIKYYWRNNLFLDFQVCIAEVEIEFGL